MTETLVGETATESKTSSARVRDMVRQDILKGVLRSGQRIKIAEIATRYGIGQMPVREALHQLEGEGLLETSAHRGAVIRSVDAKFVFDMYEIRRVLEAMLIANAARVIRADDLARLRTARDLYEIAASSQDPSEMLRRNSEFHRIINVVGDNPEAARILNRGWDLIHALRLQFGFGSSRSTQIVKEHRNLVLALEEHDTERAIAIAEDHCRAARDDLLAQLA